MHSVTNVTHVRTDLSFQARESLGRHYFLHMFNTFSHLKIPIYREILETT